MADAANQGNAVWTTKVKKKPWFRHNEHLTFSKGAFKKKLACDRKEQRLDFRIRVPLEKWILMDRSTPTS
uniref:Uncharacterized protein n=1 Tax=Romanomermis culicivorax TaxID=13658 RepID=A0A915JA27_ROMCU